MLVWKGHAARLRNAAGEEKDLASVDAGLARQRYLALRDKAADAQVMLELTNRKQGPVLELLDPASLPASPDRDDRPILAGGALLGVAAGAIVAWRRKA